jgi:hypothetical protein
MAMRAAIVMPMPSWLGAGARAAPVQGRRRPPQHRPGRIAAAQRHGLLALARRGIVEGTGTGRLSLKIAQSGCRNRMPIWPGSAPLQPHIAKLRVLGYFEISSLNRLSSDAMPELRAKASQKPRLGKLKRPRDVNQAAHQLVRESTEKHEAEPSARPHESGGSGPPWRTAFSFCYRWWPEFGQRALAWQGSWVTKRIRTMGSNPIPLSHCVTPAIAAGVTNRLWEVSDLVALIEAE